MVRDEFEAELRGFIWFSAMIETPVWQECLERREVSHHYWHGGAQLELRCPGVSRDMVRRVLQDQQSAGMVECQGRGPASQWQKKR